MTNVKLQVAPTTELIDVFNPYDGKVVESVRASTSDDVGTLLERAKRGRRCRERSLGIAGPPFWNKQHGS